MVHFVEVMYGFHEKVHWKHFRMEFGIGLDLPQKKGFLVVGDRVVDLDVV